MSDTVLETTGPYAHGAGDAEEVRFPSQGGVERSFTVILADHAIATPGDTSARGIAILDNDNGGVVLDGLRGPGGPTGPAIRIRMESLCNLGWPAFAELCRTHPRYRGGIPDIDAPGQFPEEGNLLRQASLGLAAAPGNDTRSDFVRALSEDPDVPYRFPHANRDSMSEEICRHLMFVERGGLTNHIAWDIRMNRPWNRTGRIRGGGEVDPRQDYNWRRAVETDPDLTRRAAEAALAPYLVPGCLVLDMEDYPCEFGLAGQQNGFLILKKFCGHHMSATRDVSIADRILRLDDEQLEALWVVCRVLDADLSRENRTRDMEHQMHLLRLDYDRGYGFTAS